MGRLSVPEVCTCWPITSINQCDQMASIYSVAHILILYVTLQPLRLAHSVDAKSICTV